LGLGLPLGGLGLGLPLGPLGMPLGLGLGLGLGFGRFGFPFGPFGMFPRFGQFPLAFWRNPIGKRSSEETASLNRTVCSWVATSSIIRCTGAEQNIECPAEPRLEAIRNITLRLPSLTFLPEVIKSSEGKEVSVLRMVSQTTGSRSTLIHPRTNQEVLMSIYSTQSIQEPGFWVRDAKCFDRIDALATPTRLENVRFSLVVRA